MKRISLERHQVWVYLTGLLIGIGVGSLLPGSGSMLEKLIWPLLAILLYATFLQVPLLHVREAFSDRRFVSAVLTGNFVLMPLVVWALLQFLPDNAPLRLGVLLVLLVPCTDWFISFTQLAGGDVPRAVAVTPLNLLFQLCLLPVYLWAMTDSQFSAVLSLGDVAPALLIVLLPLVAAAISERWIEAQAGREVLRDALAWWPIPLLGLVILLVAAVQVSTLQAALAWLPWVIPVYVTYLVIAALIAKLQARLWQLPHSQGRTLAFSLGTRNSFVVLPFALGLPNGWEVAALVIVVQSLVELFGMLVYLRWIPHRLFATNKTG